MSACTTCGTALELVGPVLVCWQCVDPNLLQRNAQATVPENSGADQISGDDLLQCANYGGTE